MWDGTSWTLEDIQVWSWVGDTVINSVAFTDVDGDFKADIVTGGYYSNFAQLCVWDGATLALKDVTCWKWSSATYINSVAALDVDGDWKAEVATGGIWFNSYEYEWWAQLCVWDW